LINSAFGSLVGQTKGSIFQGPARLFTHIRLLGQFKINWKGWVYYRFLM
jgi:hypothetical protein